MSQSPKRSRKKSTTSTKLYYPLTTDEWLQTFAELKPREIHLLFYLRTIDPFGDRKLEIGVRQIAKVLKCDPATVSRALKVLDQKKYIDLELINVQVQVFSRHQGVVSTQHRCPDTTLLPTDHDRCEQATTTIATQQQRSLRNRSLRTDNDRGLESSDSNASGSPHTLKTLKTDQTLSLSHPPTERELLNFVTGEVRKDKQIRQPRAYAQQTLKNDREHWLEKFVEHRNERVRIESSVAQLPNPEQEDLQALRDRLIENWNVPRLRSKIKRTIAEKPELKLEIVGDELRVLGGNCHAT
jgi:hypothetical protein